jgi:GT2 family glycosyltransferase
MSTAGIVIVTFNSADVIGECLEGCLRLPGVEVVVVDNASRDNTVNIVNAHPGVRLIANEENRGFAAGVNQGISALRNEAVLLLNPDAVPVTSIGPLAEAVSQDGAGAAGGRLVGEDGRTQTGFNVRAFPTPAVLAFEALGLNRLWPGNPVNRRYRINVPEDRVSDVDQPAGAFLMVNRGAWKAIGGFDEGFTPAWFEDVDFCKRLRDSGYRIFYLPGVAARHRGGHSASKLSWASRQLFWYGSLLRYTAKHFAPVPRTFVFLAVAVASAGRMVAGTVARASLEPVSVYSRVIWLALSRCAGVSATGRGDARTL